MMTRTESWILWAALAIPLLVLGTRFFVRLCFLLGRKIFRACQTELVKKAARGAVAEKLAVDCLELLEELLEQAALPYSDTCLSPGQETRCEELADRLFKLRNPQQPCRTNTPR